MYHQDDPREDDRDDRPIKTGRDPDEEREGWTRFEEPSRKLVKAPKTEMDEGRRGDED
jgi:hypothetical protein